MHWLYFDTTSPRKLDAAGFDYDATVGYNETVGFRAGTAQVFAPFGTEHLLELPLLIQDTSLLYPSRMHCRPKQAYTIAAELLHAVRHLGGAATISWHERSLSPERLWTGVYGDLLAELRASDASVRPAREVVAWFRARRAVDLEGACLSAASINAIALADADVAPDALRVRIHAPRTDAGHDSPSYTDLAVLPRDLIPVLPKPQTVAP
jgi:hypothetical protein